VALLDSYLSLRDFAGRRLDEQAALRWLAPHLGLRVAEFKRLPLDRQWERIAEQAHEVHGIGLPEIRRLATVCRAQLSAAAQYRPQPYAGPTVLFRAGSRRRFAERRWRSLCPQLHVEQVPGNHYSMLRQPQVAMLAQRLEDCLRQHQDQES